MRNMSSIQSVFCLFPSIKNVGPTPPIHVHCLCVDNWLFWAGGRRENPVLVHYTQPKPEALCPADRAHKKTEATKSPHSMRWSPFSSEVHPSTWLAGTGANNWVVCVCGNGGTTEAPNFSHSPKIIRLTIRLAISAFLYGFRPNWNFGWNLEKNNRIFFWICATFSHGLDFCKSLWKLPLGMLVVSHPFSSRPNALWLIPIRNGDERILWFDGNWNWGEFQKFYSEFKLIHTVKNIKFGKKQ